MKLFSQSILLQGLVILAATLLLWHGALLAPPAMTADGGGILYALLARWLAPAPLAAVIIAMLLVVAEGVVLNLLLAEHNLTPQTSLLPTLLYVICMSAPATTLSPMILANALLIACLHQLLLKGSLLTISTDRACATTAFIGIASLFYLPAALMIIAYMLAAINYRLYGWKDWAVLFLGFLAPYVALAIVLMFTGDLAQWWNATTGAVASSHIGTVAFTTLQALGNGTLLALMLAGVVSVWNISGESTVVWQKNATTTLACLIGGIAMLVATAFFPADMQFFAIPFAFSATCLLTPPQRSTSRKKRKEWIPTTLLILTFIAAAVC